MALNRNYFLNALPEQSRAIGKRLNQAVANRKLLMNKEDKPNRMRYVWP